MIQEEQEDSGDEGELSPDPQVDYDVEYLIRRSNRTDGSGSRSIRINRDRMDEERFDRRYQPSKRTSTLARKFVRQISPPEPIKTALTPPLSTQEWLRFLLVRLPILEWVWSYRLSNIIGDIIAGITVAIMHIPQGLAYALLASLPAVYGLYASVMPVIVYSILGTSRHISVGTFAVVELMIGNAIQRTLTSMELYACLPVGNLTDEDIENISLNTSWEEGPVTCGLIKRDIALTLALMTGIIMLALGILRCGFITIFLSTPLVSGYTTGAAIHVFSSQLKHISGIAIPRYAGPLSVPNTWLYFFEHIHFINAATGIISILSIIALILFKISNKLLQSKIPFPCAKYKGRERGCVREMIKWPVPIPSQLIVVVVATFISANVNFQEVFDVPVVGPIPTGAPGFTPPTRLTTYGIHLIQDAFVIAIVTYSVTVSLVQTFAREHQYTYDNNQEFMAYGIMNIIGSFFSSFPAAGSLSRSSVQANSGGKTQLVGLISSAIILVVLAALGPLFYALPNCVLASIIWVALYGMFKQFAEIWNLLKISVWDLTVWVIVFLATVLLGVDLGLAVGVGWSLLCLVLRTILPIYCVLGQVEGTEIYRNHNNFAKIKPVPGVIIFRFLGPVCFVNARVFRARLEMVSGLHGKMAASQKDGFLQQLFSSVCGRKTGDYPVTSDNKSREDTVRYHRSQSFQEAVQVDIVSVDSPQPNGGDKSPKEKSVPVHTVIIDCAPVSFLDAVGIKTLETAVLDFDKCGVQVVFAAMIKENRDRMKWAGFYRKCGKKWMFPTLQDAVDHATSGKILKPRVKKPIEKPVAAIVAPELPGESPIHFTSSTPPTQEEVQEQEAMTPVLATDAVSDEFSGLRIASDSETSSKDKDI